MRKIYLSLLFLAVAVLQASTLPFSITVPEGATLFVGKKVKHYVPFTEIKATGSTTADGKTTYAFDVTGEHNLRVSKEGLVTYAALFTPSATNTALEITADQLAGNPKAIDRDVMSNNKYNMADVFININEQGFLKLAKDETFQLVTLRSWQMTNSTVGNYYMEPDYHYTVVNDEGQPANDVVTVNDKGLLTTVGKGTAIVLVTYDAFNFSNAIGGPFFGALWPENTGVFVVSVDGEDANITTNITINEKLNPIEKMEDRIKLAGMSVDAEHDVFYYPKGTAGYTYTFKPTGAIDAVTIAHPTIADNKLSYTGFSEEGVTKNDDGSYSVLLVEGRNIVKIASTTGAEYQVFSAKPVSYNIINKTNEGEKIKAGDEIGVRFNTLYHPANKQAGVYNMAAFIQYNGLAMTGSTLGPNQYTFASSEVAQTYVTTIPADFDDDDFVLSEGVIKMNGWGDAYGNHRNITLETGKAPNLNAETRLAYFGALPDITIRLAEKPTIPGNLKGALAENTIVLTWEASRDNVEVKAYEVYVNDEKKGTTAELTYTLSDLTPATTYAIEVVAVDNEDHSSDKATVSVTTRADDTAMDKVENVLNVYPNPFAEYITIETSVADTAVIYDLSGRIVWSIPVTAGETVINTDALPAGIYLLKYAGETLRLIK